MLNTYSRLKTNRIVMKHTLIASNYHKYLIIISSLRDLNKRLPVMFKHQMIVVGREIDFFMKMSKMI